MIVSTAGTWSVNKGTVVSEEGVTDVTVISDGVNEWVTTEDPVDLIVALMNHLGIRHIGDSSDS